MKRYFQRLLPSIFVLLTTLAIPELAFAGGMPSVRSQLHTAISKLFNPLQNATRDLFYALAAVELAVFFLNHVLKNRSHEEFFSGIIKKVITLMFFLTLINEAGVWLPAIVNGIGGAGSSLPDLGTVTAGTIAGFAGKAFLDILGAPFASVGHNISNFGSDILNLNISGAFSALGKAIQGINPVEVAMEELMALIIALLVGISILWLALEYIMVQVESYLVLTFGVIMLAGGGLRWTTKYVSSYFDYAVNVGVRLFLITVIAYLDSTIVINQIMVPMLQNASSNFLQTGFNMLTLGAIMALLPKRASSFANSILSGQSTLSGGDLGKGMMQVAGGTALAGAAVAGGAVLGAGAIAGAAGSATAGSMGAASAGSAATSGGAGTMSATTATASNPATVSLPPAPKPSELGSTQATSSVSLPPAPKPAEFGNTQTLAKAPQSSAQSGQQTESQPATQQGSESAPAADAAVEQPQTTAGAPAPAPVASPSPAPASGKPSAAPAPAPANTGGSGWGSKQSSGWSGGAGGSNGSQSGGSNANDSGAPAPSIVDKVRNAADTLQSVKQAKDIVTAPIRENLEHTDSPVKGSAGIDFKHLED